MNAERQERLLVTCSPLIRNSGLQAIESLLRGQALLDPKDGKWYEVGDMRIDTETHKIYGVVIEVKEINGGNDFPDAGTTIWQPSHR